MNAVARTVFSSRRRLWLTVCTTMIVVFMVMVAVLAVRINRTLASIPTTTTTAPTVEAAPSLTTRDQEYLDSPPDDPFADLGDPRPFVLSAVEAWRSMDVEGMQKAYLPAALDQVVSTPPGRGWRITGEITVPEPGPTRSVLTLATNVRLLEVVVVGVEGRWMVESIGYRP